MTLDECLSELRTSILRDFSTIKLGPDDHYWSDAALVRYIDEAVKRFARRALCIRDSTTAEVVEVTLAADSNVYILHPSILRVTSARHQDNAQDMVRITHPIAFSRINPQTDPEHFSTRTDAYYAPATSNQPGMPLEYTTDESVDLEDNSHAIRMLVRPLPDADQAGKKIYLRTIRKPLVDLTIDDMEAVPEIPADWHIDALEWAAYRALRNFDGDAEDVAKAEKHKMRFEEAVKECKNEMEHKLLQPVTWGFGQGGFGGYVHN